MTKEQPQPHVGKRFSDFGDGGASWYSPDGMFEQEVDPNEPGDRSFPPADQVFGIRDSEL